VADGRFLQLYSESEAITIWSDQALLGRVVANMTKNALEASAPGDTVTLGCDNDHDYLRIWVHNPQPMPRRVQLQIFQRSFSTKGDSRGLGTYSMKLLSERYLQGRVSFESNEEAGTTFSVMIPMEWAAFPEEPELTAVARNGTQTPVPCPCD
jgi:signal transduction histidine kinase